VTIQRAYYCDLCGANGGAEPLRGLYWERQATHEALVEKPWREVEHHICNKCLADLQRFPVTVTPKHD
jgi:hypothetical protein